MLVEFVLMRHPNGECIVSQFAVSIEYEVQSLEFNIGSFRTPDNLKQILNQYATIDEIKRVDLIGCTPLPWYRPAQPRLNAIVMLGSEDIVRWSVFVTAKHPFPVLERMILQRLMPILQPAEIIVAGTVRAVLSELKEQKRQAVREAAIRRARVMCDNANAILTFLNVL